MYPKKFKLVLFFLSIAISGFTQLSYNTVLLGHWSNDSLPMLGNPDGERFNELWGYFDSVKSKEYIIMGGIDSTYFFDVTNPAKIKLCDVEAGRVSGCVNRDYQTYKHYAYAVNDKCPGSLQIFDLQFLPDSVHKVFDSDTLGSTTHTICVYKDMMFMCSNTVGNNPRKAMRLVSLAQPERPTTIATFDAPVVGGFRLFSNVHDMIAVDDTAYLSCGDDGLFIFDFTDLKNPKYVYDLSQYSEKGYNHNSWLTADKKHIMFTDENLGLGVKYFEIVNPKSYRYRSIFHAHTGAMAHSPFIVGNFTAYISYYQDGVYKYDLTDEANPNIVAYYDTYPENAGGVYTGFQGCWGVYPFLPSGNIFASDMTHGLFALQMNGSGVQNYLKKESISLDPNPARNETTLKLFAPAVEIAWLEITNAQGQKIDIKEIELQYGKNNLSLETSALSSGIYFIQITSSHAAYTAKLIIQ